MIKQTEKFDQERRVWSTHFAHFWLVPEGDIGYLLVLAGQYKPPTGFSHKPYEVTVEMPEQGSSLASHRMFHSSTQAHHRVSEVQQKMCSLRKQRTRAPSILTLF